MIPRIPRALEGMRMPNRTGDLRSSYFSVPRSLIFSAGELDGSLSSRSILADSAREYGVVRRQELLS